MSAVATVWNITVLRARSLPGDTPGQPKAPPCRRPPRVPPVVETQRRLREVRLSSLLVTFSARESGNVSSSFEISVIVTTYNWPHALAAVLSALGEQDYSHFEIVVADDGSDWATTAVIQDHAVRRRRSLLHVWQPDEGFRAAAIRNKAIRNSKGDYVIFLDGDCIPRPEFVSRHAALAEEGSFVTGNRVLLSRKATKRALSNDIALHRLSFTDWLRWRLTGRVNRLLPLISLPDSRWRQGNRTKWKGAMSCNLAVWRHDLDTINGFDERYRGWGLEDSDLVIRLFNSGVFRKEGRFATAVIHLWHEKHDRRWSIDNWTILKAVQETGAIRATKGLDQLPVRMP